MRLPRAAGPEETHEGKDNETQGDQDEEKDEGKRREKRTSTLFPRRQLLRNTDELWGWDKEEEVLLGGRCLQRQAFPRLHLP